MTFLTVSAAAIATVVATAYGLGQLAPKEIRTSIEIDAPPAAVWQILTDGERFAYWNPFVLDMRGTLEVGETLAVTIQPEGQPAMTFTPEVLASREDEELRWVGKLGVKGVFDGEHFFRLEKTAQGGTVLHHGEDFRGALAYVIFAMIGEDTRAGFEAMNNALKSRVETGV